MKEENSLMMTVDFFADAGGRKQEAGALLSVHLSHRYSLLLLLRCTSIIKQHLDLELSFKGLYDSDVRENTLFSSDEY